MELFRFESPEYFWFLIAVPILFFLYFFSEKKKRRMLEKAGDLTLFVGLMPGYSRYRKLLKYIILSCAIIFLIIAGTRPRYVSKIKTKETINRELVIALDVSTSMLAQDIKPDRMQRAKQMISELYKKNRGSRIGLIIFAGEAFVQIPMTMSYSEVDVFLSSVSAGSIPLQGTNISAAIELSEAMFDQTQESDKLLLIFSDGENHEQDAIESAKQAKEKGIVISTIGVGKEAATPIPDPDTGDYKKDQNGKVVLSKLNEVLLTQVANAGGGNYYRTGGLLSDLQSIQNQIDQLGKSGGNAEVEDYAELFPYFVWVAILLLLTEFFLLDKRNEQLSNWRIFRTIRSK